MQNFVLLEKRSKKDQKAYHASQRGSWNGVSPVPRFVPSGKTYNRQKMKQQLQRSRYV